MAPNKVWIHSLIRAAREESDQGPRCTEDERKLFVQLLPKLYIPDEVAIERVKLLILKVDAIGARRPLVDAVSKNALGRFEKALVKTFGDDVEAFDSAPESAAQRDQVESKFKAWLKRSDRDDDEDVSEEEQEDDDEEETHTASEGLSGEDDDTVIDEPVSKARRPRSAAQSESEDDF